MSRKPLSKQQRNDQIADTLFEFWSQYHKMQISIHEYKITKARAKWAKRKASL